MKRTLLGMISALVLAAPFGAANAADLALKAPPPAAPAWNWSGFYPGIEGGGGWAHSSQIDTFGVTSGRYDQSGGLFGGTIGYNWQSGRFVFGVEGDWSWAGIDGSVTLPGICTAGGGTVCFTNMRDFGTARARIGVTTPSNQFLFYVTGGAAGANIRSGQESCSTPVPGAIASCGTKNEYGGTVGVGIEGFILPHWTAKVEYLYTTFGYPIFYTVVIPVRASETDVNIVRAGINYHF
jgi:outer membrane immunogenic protein